MAQPSIDGGSELTEVALSNERKSFNRLNTLANCITGESRSALRKQRSLTLAADGKPYMMIKLIINKIDIGCRWLAVSDSR